MDLAFWMDVVVNLRTAYLNSEYSLVVAPRQLADKYFNDEGGWIDVLASIPLDYFVSNGRTAEFLKLNRLLRLRRLIRSMSGHSHSAALEGNHTKAAWINIANVFGFFLLFAHYVGCIYWAIGTAQFDCVQDALEGGNYSVSTLTQQFAADPLQLTALNLTASLGDVSRSPFDPLPRVT